MMTATEKMATRVALNAELVAYEQWVKRVFSFDIRPYRDTYTSGAPGYSGPDVDVGRLVNMGLNSWLEAKGLGALSEAGKASA